VYSFEIPYHDRASIENAVHCCITALVLGIETQYIQYFSDLPQVAMRLEQKSGKHNCTIINDSYNSDLQSLTHFNFCHKKINTAKKHLFYRILMQITPDKKTCIHTFHH
jgi:UDP-N-acetylmuramyl pentapeptide synthase